MYNSRLNEGWYFCAGFTGLTAALMIAKEGNDVVVFEQSNRPGGLALGFREKNWQWPVESHYHHLFVSDYSIKRLAESLNHKIHFRNTKTKLYYEKKIYQLDSVTNLLKFSKLPFQDRIRMGLVLLYLRLTPFWKPLEKISAEKFLKSSMGNEVWDVVWKPLFVGKFGKNYKSIPASWFWARIKKRSAKLGYPDGGSLSLAQTIVKSIKRQRGKIFFNTPVKSINSFRGCGRFFDQMSNIFQGTQSVNKI